MIAYVSLLSSGGDVWMGMESYACMVKALSFVHPLVMVLCRVREYLAPENCARKMDPEVWDNLTRLKFSENRNL